MVVYVRKNQWQGKNDRALVYNYLLYTEIIFSLCGREWS